MGNYQKALDLWNSYNIQSESDLDKHLENFRILFAFHSGKIENENVTYHDTREIFENQQVTGYTGDLRAIFEQQNQRMCYEYLKSKIAAKEPVSVELIKEIHRILTSGTYDERRYIANDERPGEFKKHDYVTGIHEVGTVPELVKQELQELVSEINEIGRKEPLKAGAYLHAGFETIHPFADGNGRVGRTLLNYWLMINNHPPLIIYNEDKGQYYNCLQAYDESENMKPLYNFLKAQTGKTWEKTLERGKDKVHRRRKLSDTFEER